MINIDTCSICSSSSLRSCHLYLIKKTMSILWKLNLKITVHGKNWISQFIIYPKANNQSMRHIQRRRRDPYAQPPVPSLVTIVKLKTELDPHSSDAVCLGRVDSQSQGGSFGPKNNWADKKEDCLYVSRCLYVYRCIYVYLSLCLCLYVFMSFIVCTSLCFFYVPNVSLSMCFSMSLYISVAVSLCLSVCLCCLYAFMSLDWSIRLRDCNLHFCNMEQSEHSNNLSVSINTIKSNPQRIWWLH